MNEALRRTAHSESSLLYAPLLLAAVLAVLAGCHRLGLDEPAAYRASLLIPAEFFLLLGTCISALAVAGMGAGALFRRDWASAAHAATSIAGSAALVSVAMWLDAPTLVFLT